MLDVVTSVTTDRPVEQVWRFMSDVDHAIEGGPLGEAEPVKEHAESNGY